MELKRHEHQVAGSHGNSSTNLLQTENSMFVFKPILPNKEKELMFYEEGKDLGLNKFMPSYHGKLVIQDINHIKLENLCQSFKRPNVFDIKMGTETFEPDASTEKKKSQISKYPYCADLGFVMSGMKKWDMNKQQYDVLGTRHLCLLNPNDKPNPILSTFRHYFKDAPAQIITQFLNLLSQLRKIIGQLKTHRFIGSSLLFIWEGEQVVLKMIDFAHVVPNNEIDYGYVKGLNHMIGLLQQLKDESF